MHLFAIKLSLLLLSSVIAVPQQQSISLDSLVNDIFNQDVSTPNNNNNNNNNVQNTTPTERTGFNVVVTPEPQDTSQIATKFVSISGREPCTCVRYHMCDPNANTVTEDGEFDGFGSVDWRFGTTDDEPVCDHPLDKCCGSNQRRSTSLNPTPQEQRPNRARGCGVRNVGGIDFQLQGATDYESGYGEFPWTVALLYAQNHSYFCAGSLIHPKVVLTALHCVRDRAPSSFLVRAGEWDTQTTRERLPFEEQNVAKVLLHPRFNPRNVAYNFALVILKDAFTMGDHINTICLPAQGAEPNAGTSCLATGWGKNLFGAAGRFSVIMKRIPLPIVEFNTCQTKLRTTRLGPKFALNRSFLCAGGQSGIDTCQGDGGAPLACPIGIASENRYEQSGIVSWGIGCNDDIPAAYANVALVRDWIDEEMLANGFVTTTYTA